MRRFIKFFFIALTIAGCGDAPVDEILENANSTIVFPQVDSSSAPAGATGVSIRPNIVITFSEPMNSESVEQNIKFERAGYGQVNVIKNWFDNNKTLSLSVVNNLELNNIYLIEISANAMSQAGYKMRNDFTTHFTTSHIDNAPPLVIGTSPDDGAVNVPGGQNIIVYFSKDMNKTSAEQAFSLKDSSGQSISGTFSWAGSNMIFTPGVKLTPFMNYSINVSNSAVDYMGNYITSNTNIFFNVFGKYIFKKSLNSNSKLFHNIPRDMTVFNDNGTEYIYVCDTGNNRIIKYKKNIIHEQSSMSIIYVREWGGYGVANGEFNQPCNIANDSEGNIYVTDRGNSRVQKFDKNGVFISKFGSQGSSPGYFSGLYGIVIDKDKNIYTSEQTTNRIQKFDSNFNLILTWGSTGAGDNQFNTPMSIDIDSDNNIYVLDSYNHYIKKFDRNGIFILKWGGVGGSTNQIGDSYNNYLPHGLCIDTNNDVYVSYEYFSWPRISKFTSDGTYINRFNTNSHQSGITIDKDLNIYQTYFNLSGVDLFDGGVNVFNQSGVLKYQFGNKTSNTNYVSFARSIAFDENDNIYITRLGPKFVKVFDKNLNFLREWGDFGTGDGQFNTNSAGRYSILYRNGKLYICDNTKVQIFDISGNYISKLNVAFNHPKCLSTDLSNNLYILDQDNERIVKYDNNDNLVTTNWKSASYTLWASISPKSFYYEWYESSPYTIRKFDLSGTLLKTISLKGIFTFDQDGNYYLLNSSLNRLEKYDSNDNLLLSFGEFGSGDYEFKFDDFFNNPMQNISVNKKGELFVIDPKNDRIQVYTPVSE